jgi:hypothetical protein
MKASEISICGRCGREGVVFNTVEGKRCGCCAPRDILGTVKIAGRPS